jgi:calpain-15
MGNRSFIDPYFPPLNTSITGGTTDFKKRVQWRRPGDFFRRDDFSLYSGGIEPGDIMQGELGDCWFMCALSSLAERPQLVERLFLTKEVNQAGIYTVKFCKGGEWVNVTVDDYFPCYVMGQPIFSRSHGTELWVLLLEKAFAKLHGSYMQLRGGWVNEGMIDLTGCPTLTYKFEKEDVRQMIENDLLWVKFKSYDDEGSLLTASTPG